MNPGYYCPVRQCTWDGYVWRRRDDGEPFNEIAFQQLINVVKQTLPIYESEIKKEDPE